MKKQEAIELAKDTDKIIACKGYSNYILVDSYNEFQSEIVKSTCSRYFEYIPRDKAVKLFFDIDMKREDTSLPSLDGIVDKIKTTVVNTLNDYAHQFVVLESHSDAKYSFHIIVNSTKDNRHYHFENVAHVQEYVKHYFEDMISKNCIDISVYREGLFRTFMSSKPNEKRPFIQSIYSDDFEFTDTFVACCPNANQDNVVSYAKENTDKPPQELTQEDRKSISSFIRKVFKFKSDSLRDIFIDRDHNCIVIPLDETYCEFVEREHKSNHQYIVIDTTSAKQKCHDSECKDKKHNELFISKYPSDIGEIIMRCLSVNKHETELIHNASQECRSYISQNFDQEIDSMHFDKQNMVFRTSASRSDIVRLNGKCRQCQIEHQISNSGYCIRCTVCGATFPSNVPIPVDNKYPTITRFWQNYQQLVNNGTVNIINNYYNNSTEEDFSCDVSLDNRVFNDRHLTDIINGCLDGHKITKLAELMFHLHDNFVFTGNDWLIFDKSRWTSDKRSLAFKKKIMELCPLLYKVKTYYENGRVDDVSMNLIKNVKSLVNKLNKPQLKEDIIKESQMFFIDNEFLSNLNSKKHLLPFNNGVYDLLTHAFRETSKEDYVNLTLGFSFDPEANNTDVHTFLQQVLPNPSVRAYVLRKMAECLNGDIPNTNFVMFIGDGANGKSQLLNLMKLSLGEFGEKVEVTLLTRKRNNANETNCEKIKLMNKRFAFLSEPEDGEKINIGLLKELTGSEEIVARGLYQESVSFVMEAKLFLACNELPQIKGEDTALWRRIRVVDFPSRFVDNPSESFEFKIDKSLSTRIREDVTWRQTFINILIQHYKQDIPEPREVMMATQNYRSENDIALQFVQETCRVEVGNKELRTFCVELWDAYEAWCRDTRCQSIGQTRLYCAIDNITAYKRTRKVRKDGKLSKGWYGISVIPDTRECLD